MKILQTLLLLSLLSSATFSDAFAQQGEKKASPFRLLIKGGLEYGGDDVAEIYFVDGSTQSVKAGQGASVAIGAEFQVPALKKLLFHATAGYKFVTTRPITRILVCQECQSSLPRTGWRLKSYVSVRD